MAIEKPFEPRKPRKYLIEMLFPIHTVNLIVGPADTGKTNWMLRMMLDYAAGKPVLEGESHPVPMAYILADRTMCDSEERFGHLKLPDPPPWFSWQERGINHPLTDVVKYLPIETRLLMVDGLTMYLPDGKVNDFGVVARWIKELRSMCELKDLTIVGTVQTGKTTEKNKIIDPRQRAIGSVSWRGLADTVIVMEPHDPSMEDNLVRVMHVYPKNHPARRYDFKVSSETGGLVQSARLSAGRMNLVNALPQGTPLTLDSICEYGKGLGMGEEEVKRMITPMLSNNELDKISEGVFQRKVSDFFKTKVIKAISAGPEPADQQSPTSIQS